MAKFLNMNGIRQKETSGLNDVNTTHVLLEHYEYRRLLEEIQMLQTENRMKDFSLDGKIRALEEANDKKIQAVQQQAQKKLDEKDCEIEEARQEVRFQKTLNETLLRISRERANADRNLRPKGEHSGYVVLRSAERDHTYRVKQRNVTVRLWETVLQTPYSIDFSADQAKGQTLELFEADMDGNWPINKIGITGLYLTGYSVLATKDKAEFDEYVNANSVLQIRMQANYKTGYWEVTLLHTLPLDVVPPEMRA